MTDTEKDNVMLPPFTCQHCGKAVRARIAMHYFTKGIRWVRAQCPACGRDSSIEFRDGVLP